MKIKNKAILLGVLSAFFFAATFVLNRSMSDAGGSWIWSASFRYYWMTLLLLPIVWVRGELPGLWQAMRANIGNWVLWSTIGFGLFYAGITYAGSFAPAWLVAGTWQLTLIAGIAIAPLLEKKAAPIPRKTWLFSAIILLGIVLLQIPEAKALSLAVLLSATIPLLIAAFAYPLGNRKMMLLTKGELSTLQRLFGMTIASLPFWIILSVYGFLEHPAPQGSLLLQTFTVALFSGVIATWLFFKATELVRHDPKGLAAVEATQSTEVLFALAAEILFLHAAIPSSLSLIGIAVVILGMILHSLKS
ncbi:DMT family transporter [Sphingobacterium sp. MYb382]|uniref:DMT family transporter n=1 Tax=Sphingobacterium sp. MYb382 TaxID=2745278 RepID=UPI0030AF91E9